MVNMFIMYFYSMFVYGSINADKIKRFAYKKAKERKLFPWE